MMLRHNAIREAADLLHDAQRTRRPIGPLTERFPGLDVAATSATAHRANWSKLVSSGRARRRLIAGDRDSEEQYGHADAGRAINGAAVKIGCPRCQRGG